MKVKELKHELFRCEFVLKDYSICSDKTYISFEGETMLLYDDVECLPDILNSYIFLIIYPNYGFLIIYNCFDTVDTSIKESRLNYSDVHHITDNYNPGIPGKDLLL